MNKNFDVSVIIPTYNRISMLEEALQSVFTQEFDGTVEIIVIDDNSSDGTSDMIHRKFPEVRLIQFKENRGSYIARNHGLREAKGKYIATLDSDDLWEVNYLSSQMAALEGKEKCFCVSNLVSWYVVENKKKIDIQTPDLNRYTSPIHHMLVESFILTPSSVLFPRQLFDEVGFFDENIKLGADTDLYIRCLLNNYSLIFSEQCGVIRRVHNQGQMTDGKNLRKRKKSRIYRIEKFYPQLKEDKIKVSSIRIYAELNANFASLFFRRKYFRDWLICSILSGYYESPQYAINNMRLDFVNTKAFKRIQKKLANPQSI